MHLATGIFWSHGYLCVGALWNHPQLYLSKCLFDWKCGQLERVSNPGLFHLKDITRELDSCAILNVANIIAQAATYSGLGCTSNFNFPRSDVSAANCSPVFCCLRVYAVSNRSVLLSIIVAISMAMNVVGQLVRYLLLFSKGGCLKHNV